MLDGQLGRPNEMTKLTTAERQTLTGPVVIGCILGAFVGLASWGFDSEYGHFDHWRMALNAALAFFASFALALVPLAVLPIAFRRLRQRKQSTANE